MQMLIPDDINFAPDNNDKGKHITFGDIRRSGYSENKLIQLLSDRLQKRLINQTEAISNSDFPLLVLTYIGISTLGEIFYKRKSKNNQTNLKE